MNLNIDEKENLLALMQSAGWKPLLKILDQLEQNQKNRVLNYSLTDGPEGLVIEKARAEGAKTLVRAIKDFREREVKGDR